MNKSNLYRLDQEIQDECLENALKKYYKDKTNGNYFLVQDVLDYMKPSEKCIFKNFVHAVSDGDINLVTMFEETGINIFKDDNKAFKLAVLKGYINIIEFFLSKGADINIIDNELITHNIQRGRCQVIEVLRKYGAKI